MNVRVSASVSSLTKLLKALSLRQYVRTMISCGERPRVAEESGTLSNSVGLSVTERGASLNSNFSKPHNVKTESVNVEPESVNVEPKSVNVEPKSVNVEPEGVNVEPESVNVEPKSVNVEPKSVNVEPEGVNVEPESVNVKLESVNASLCFQHANEAKVYRASPTFALTVSHPVHTLKQTHRPPSQSRHFHSSSLCHTHPTQTALQRNVTQHQGSARARSKNRIPLSQSVEIEEVLSEHEDVIQEFAAVLGCSEEAMRDMVRRDTRLLTQFNKEGVMAKMRLLLDKGFTPAEILSRYQIFSRSYHGIQSRLQAMAPVKHYKYSLAIVLLSDHDFQARMAMYLKEVAVMGNHSSQASFVADLLECSEDDVRILSEQYEFLLTLPPSRLQKIVGVVRSFGLSVEDIREKCLMLKCPPDVARDRLQRVEDAGVFDKELVSYILTNSEAHFEASFATWVHNARALGSHANERELLMHKLQCSEEDVQSLMRRKSSVAHLRSAKIKRCLEILQNEVGLSSETILREGSLLYYSPRRLRARWALLKSLDLSEHDRTRELLLSEKKFVAKYGYGSD